MATEFKLPEVGEGIDSGVVVSILVSEGDTVEVDQPVLELETDKAVVEVPSSVSGKVQSINVKENDEAQVGQVIMTLGEGDASADEASDGDSGDDAETEDDSKDSSDKAESSSQKTESENGSGEEDTGGSGSEEFKLPELGEGIDAGTVVAILVSEGDTIEVDQPVLELETDKAVVEVPSGVSGTVQSINVKANEEASVGQVILTVGGGGGASKSESQEASMSDSDKSESSDTKDKSKSKDSEKKASSGQAAPSTQADGEGSSKLVPAAPSVRRLAREMDVDIRQIQGSGILGRISAQDVRTFAETGSVSRGEPAKESAPASAPAAPKVELPDFSKWGETEREPMSGIRKATVRSMTQAWSNVPMVTQFDKADITEFEALRKKYQPKAEAAGVKLTPTAMLIKVVAGALKKFPDFNASIDTENNEIVYKKYVNIGIAVDTPNGLLVPVIKNADAKNMIGLAVELDELAAKARDRKLSPDEMQGGNFNISNLGGIGGTGFTPIVNPPQVAILGVSRGGMEPIWNKETAEFVPRMMMPMSVTYDHRLIDGAAAARFLRWICTAIEDPFLLALEG